LVQDKPSEESLSQNILKTDKIDTESDLIEEI